MEYQLPGDIYFHAMKCSPCPCPQIYHLFKGQDIFLQVVGNSRGIIFLLVFTSPYPGLPAGPSGPSNCPF